MERHCLYCNKTIQGRSDKKFCDDQCRSAYNYQKKGGHSVLVRKVVVILKKNRQIMLELLKGNYKKKVHRDKLLALGFDFGYYTNIYRTTAGAEYFFCFELGYLYLEDGWMLLVTKSNHPLEQGKG